MAGGYAGERGPASRLRQAGTRPQGNSEPREGWTEDGSFTLWDRVDRTTGREVSSKRQPSESTDGLLSSGAVAGDVDFRGVPTAP